MIRILFCLMLVQVAVIRPCLARQVEDFFRKEFREADIIYIGEFHTVAEHKENLAGLLKSLMMDGTVDGFAFEFSRASSQAALDRYLRDSEATAGSEKEAEYFKQLNRSYSNMFNVKEFDAIMRLMKQIWIARRGKIAFCAIDEVGLNQDNEDNGQKYQVLRSFPQVVQDEIEKVSGQSIQNIAKDWPAFDREAAMGVNVANCAARAKKTIAFVGMGHAMRTERVFPSDWRTAARFTEVVLPSKKVKSALFAQAYFDPSDSDTLQIPMFSQKCRALNEPATVGYSSHSVPDRFAPCLEAVSQDGSQRVSYARAFDFIVFGPTGTKIDPNPERK